MTTPDFIAYIIGPYRAPTISGVRRNIEAARELAELLWRNNIPTICSHLNTALMDGIAKDQVFLDGDLVLLSRCDIAFVLFGAEHSKGCQGELCFAKDHDIPVVHIPDDHSVWIPEEINQFILEAISRNLPRKDSKS